MTERYSEKKGKVVFAEASSAVRQLISEVIKNVGFTDIQGVGSIKDALAVLEVDQVDWLILPLANDDDINAIQALKIITEFPQLKATATSLLLEENQYFCLGKAFELGLLSYHEKPFTRDSLQESFQSLFATFERNSWIPCQTAAENLRNWIRETDFKRDWLAFEKNMSKLMPGDPRSLLALAEPLLSTGDLEKGKSTLEQVKLLDESLVPAITKLSERYLQGENIDASNPANLSSVLRIKKCLIVDPDASTVETVKGILSAFGVTEVEHCEDGEKASEYLSQNQDVDVIFQEWRIPKLSGPYFLQRLRSTLNCLSPVIVISSLLKDNDLPLVREMGVSSLVAKPIDQKTFMRSLVYSIQQDRSPTDQNSMEIKIRNLLSSSKIDDARKLLTTFVSNKSFHPGRKIYLEAEMCYTEGHFESARDKAFQSLKQGGESLLVLNLLGKTLMQLRDFPSALKCYEKAQNLSPLNIERLCSIAEAQSEVETTDATALATLDKAKALDPTSSLVVETSAKLATASGDTGKAKSLMEQLENLDAVISHLNNKAVAFAVCGQVQDGIELYRRTIASLPDNKVELRSAVYYNLALAYARNNELEEALSQIDRALKGKVEKLSKKASSLKRRLEKSIKDGSTFSLNAISNQGVAASAESGDEKVLEIKEKSAEQIAKSKENRNVVAAMQSKQGEIGCYLIFFSDESANAQSDQLIEKLPRFALRGAITRAESLGLENLMKRRA